MRDKHNFSKSYLERKESMINALHREEAAKEASKSRFSSCVPLKALVCVAILSVLTVSVYATVQWIDFRLDQDGDEVRVHASLNDTGEPADDKDEKPLRSWRAEDGEISVRLNIPNLPSDMSEDKTANGKYGSDDSSRAMTVNGIDLRRSDLDQLISGATATKSLTVGTNQMYVIEKGEADYYSRIAYIVFEDEELVLKLWVSHGITDAELSALASTMTVDYTDDTLLAIPILNEVGGGSSFDIPDVFYREEAPIYEADLLEIGESARDHNDWYTVTVNGVEIYDNINVLASSYILDEDFASRFVDEDGNFIPYNRTEVIFDEDGNGGHTKRFTGTVSAKKKLYVVTLTMADFTMDNISEADREDMLKACVNSFDLHAYTVSNGEIDMTSSNAVVDRTPNERAVSSEIIYREYIGNDQWRVAYLIDEDTAEGGLVLGQYTGKIYVKVQ